MMIGLEAGCKHHGWPGCTQPRPSAWESEREHEDAYDDLLGKTPDQINHCGERTTADSGGGSHRRGKVRCAVSSSLQLRVFASWQNGVLYGLAEPKSTRLPCGICWGVQR